MALSLGALALLAGLSKLADFRSFAEILGQWGVLPDHLVKPAALGVTVGELTAAVLLLGVGTRAGGLLLGGLLLLFSAAALKPLLVGGQDVRCGCLTRTASPTLGWRSLARNALLAGCAAWVVALDPAPHLTLPGGLAATALALTVLVLERVDYLREFTPSLLRLSER